MMRAGGLIFHSDHLERIEQSPISSAIFSRDQAEARDAHTESLGDFQPSGIIVGGSDAKSRDLDGDSIGRSR